MARELESCLAHHVPCSCGQRDNPECLVVHSLVGGAVLHPGMRFGLPVLVSTWHRESFSFLIPSPWFALNLMMTQTQLVGERAEHCLDAIPELGSCTVPLPWLSTGGPWSYLVVFSPDQSTSPAIGWEGSRLGA